MGHMLFQPAAFLLERQGKKRLHCRAIMVGSSKLNSGSLRLQPLGMTPIIEAHKNGQKRRPQGFQLLSAALQPIQLNEIHVQLA